MIPSKNQYKKWSIPSKWTFWAGIIGIPLAIISIILAILGFIPKGQFLQDKPEHKNVDLVLQVAQELRYNKNWLSELAIAYETQSGILPIGSMKIDALEEIVKTKHRDVIANSYGEEKYIYQEIIKLTDLARALNKLESMNDLEFFNHHSNYVLHDIAFLNDFIFWYLSPMIKDQLPDDLFSTLGWYPTPSIVFSIEGVKTIKLKYFFLEDEPINDFGIYLGLLD